MTLTSTLQLFIERLRTLEEDFADMGETFDDVCATLELLDARCKEAESNLREYWRSLSPQERHEIASRGGRATWARHTREEISRLQSEGHKREDPEVRKRRASIAAKAMHAKYDDDTKREWSRRGGLNRAHSEGEEPQQHEGKEGDS